MTAKAVVLVLVSLGLLTGLIALMANWAGPSGSRKL